MKDQLKVQFPEEEAKTGILPVGQPVVLYLCPRDYWKNQSKAWRSDIGNLRIETGAIPVWGSAIGNHSGFDGMRFADIRKDYDTLREVRNSINHGKGNNSFEELKRELDDSYKKCLDVIHHYSL